jgi:uncharacterized protein YndB with AHSA1/START domain
MRPLISLLALLTAALVIPPACADEQAAKSNAATREDKIQSKIQTTEAGELILVETVLIAAPIDKVWDAYTTTSGYAAWAAPVVQIDFRVGGTIRTHYGANAKIGDPGTNTLRIVNYVPQKLLTLQADVSDNWPEIMKSQAKHLYNVIQFEELPGKKTRIVSYGLGYRDNQEMRNLMNFFIRANRSLYAELIAFLESEGQANSTAS